MTYSDNFRGFNQNWWSARSEIFALRNKSGVWGFVGDLYSVCRRAKSPALCIFHTTPFRGFKSTVFNVFLHTNIVIFILAYTGPDFPWGGRIVFPSELISKVVRPFHKHERYVQNDKINTFVLMKILRLSLSSFTEKFRWFKWLFIILMSMKIFDIKTEWSFIYELKVKNKY